MRSGQIFSSCPTSAVMDENLKGLTAGDGGVVTHSKFVGDACGENGRCGVVFGANRSTTRRWKGGGRANGNEKSL